MSMTTEQPQTHPKALWDRYTELTAKPEPTTDEQDEATRLKGRLQLPPELADLLLSEAERCESLIQQEPDAIAEEQAAFPAAYQQGFRTECIMAGIGTDIDHRPQDKERHHKARLKLQAIAAAKSELAQMYRHWPELFGLPGPGWANASDHISGLPVAVQTFMQANGLRIPEYVSPHRPEFNQYADTQDDPPHDFIAHPWGGQ